MREESTSVADSTELTGATWKKSARSNPNGACVEVTKLPDGRTAVRHSRNVEGPAIIYTRAEIEAFMGGVKDGEFDYLLG